MKFLTILLMSCVSLHASHDQLSCMSLDEKIGQLFMVASVMDEQANQTFIKNMPYSMLPEQVRTFITQYHVGGVIFLGSGTKEQLKQLTDEYRALASNHSHVPLMIGLDAEWGLSMRLKDGMTYPRNMALGAIEDEDLIQELGQKIGQECAELGVDINFAPVVDVNTNPKNPVIHMRSFGADPEKVATRAKAFADGLRQGGVIACAKHFPGHGDADIDSHVALPTIRHDQVRLEHVELHPFKKMIEHKVPAIMTAHLSVPALDETGSAATLSRNIITDLLRNELGFDGLIITDGLGMHALNHDDPGQVELQALLAGNDILLCPVHLPEAIEKIKQAVQNDKALEVELDAHVRRILNAKQMAKKLKAYTASYTIDAYQLKRKLYEAAVTLIDDKNLFVPLHEFDNLLLVHVGNDQAFYEQLQHVVPVTQINSADLDELDQKAKIICVIMDINPRMIIQFDDAAKKNEPDVMKMQAMIDAFQQRNMQPIFINFCSPYLVARLQEVGPVIQAYEYDPVACAVVEDILLGRLKTRGTLPIQ